ncbi:hypothetical protein FQN49_001507 [Arthroderma sp. PD_2]|nr:hypothetical protein FQN49_001507 [Arthroderma sp. PD_2]
MEVQGPDAEFHSDRKREIIAAIKDKIEGNTSSPLWAGLWLADLECLESILRTAESPITLLGLAIDYGVIVRFWGQRERSRSPATSQPSSPSRSGPTQSSSPLHRLTTIGQATLRDEATEGRADQPASTSVTPPRPAKRRRFSSDSRSKGAAQGCRSRDENKCLITEYLDPIDVAHIFPFSMRNISEHDDRARQFWQLLRVFWKKERVDAWYAASISRGTEVVNNLICFAPHIHRWHSKGLFALQPIHQSEDRKQLTVKFYWLPQREFAQHVDLLDAPTIPDKLTGIKMAYKAWNVRTEEKVVSGTEIVMKTSDPDNLPLPDWDLLDLQWVLQRLTALSGAADVYDDYDDDDSSEIQLSSDVFYDELDNGDGDIHIHDDIPSPDQDVEPFCLSPRVPKSGRTTYESADLPVS